MRFSISIRRLFSWQCHIPEHTSCYVVAEGGSDVRPRGGGGYVSSGTNSAVQHEAGDNKIIIFNLL
jgi:hypothetical protein